MAHNLNVIGVCWLEFAVLGQSAPKKHNREKSPDTFVTHMKFLKHVSAMFDNQKILLLWQQNKQISHALAAWSASRALFTWSQCTTWAKVFYFTVIAHTSAKVRKKNNRMATWSKNHYLSISFTEWKTIPPWFEFAEN